MNNQTAVESTGTPPRRQLILKAPKDGRMARSMTGIDLPANHFGFLLHGMDRTVNGMIMRHKRQDTR